MRRAIPFTALILLAAFVLSGFSSQEIIVGRRRATASPSRTVVQTVANSKFGTNPSQTIALGASLASGDVLILHQYGDSGATMGNPSGCVTSWNTNGNDTATTNQQDFYGVSNTTGTCNVTISATGTSKNIAADIVQCHGCSGTPDGTSSFDREANCSPTCNWPSLTTSSDGSLVCGSLINGTAGNTASAPWVAAYSGSDSQGTKHFVTCYARSPAGANATPGYTPGGGGNNGYRTTQGMQ